MEQYIDKSSLVAEIKRILSAFDNSDAPVDRLRASTLIGLLSFIDTLEVKRVDISNISENLAEAYEYLDYTSTGNLAHNKPMVSARLKKAIRGLFDARLFELTHDKKYRMENLGLTERRINQ